MALATSSREIWSALKGLLCLHKPSGLAMQDLLKTVNDKIIKELNLKNPEYAERLEKIHQIQKHSGLVNYSSHPYVLGDGFTDDDVIFEPVNNLSEFTSGLVLVGVNDPEIREQIRTLVLPRQYIMQIELGIATDNGFKDGKVVERSTWTHLKSRPQLLEKNLAQIRSSHQRDAFRQAGVNLRSKQAYQLAVQGLVRPTREHQGATLLYGLDCVHYSPPHISLKVTCLNESPIYLAEFTSELGLKLRTNAVLNSLQLVRYGPFGVDTNPLLLKHVDLQSVIDNIHKNSKYLDLLSEQRDQTLNWTNI